MAPADDVPTPDDVRVTVTERSLPLRSPLGTATGEIDERPVFLVGLTGAFADGSPCRGIGEAAPLPPWTESVEDCRHALADARETVATGGAVALDDLPPAARHALSLASADARARRDGVTLSQALAAATADGGDPAESVRVNATVGDGSVAATVAAAESAVSEGFDCLKCKVGARPVDEDTERLRAVRDAVGDDVALRADANGAWGREEAERAVDALADVGLEYLEQPVPAADHEALRALRGRGVAIAVDETVNTPASTAEWPDPIEEYADVAVLKPMALGGPGETVAVARDLRDRGVDTVVTTTIDGAVARTAAVHVAAAVPGGDDRAHGLATGALLERDVVDDDPAPVDAGRITVPAGPGVAGDAFDGVQNR
ncbi:mandelate racemase/muconate lactonizing enzyme family protein [Halobaculum marinum]|uniref:o-succinylbenzoate synthase n=1 Tax=Halobaculum marinum TaxID=3031996 RepID=A0ABD5WUC5_9EURY|nr:enolase C-terminal domain-like protein [Halobaculum sp. DT55]